MTEDIRDKIAASYIPGVTSLRFLADKFQTNHHYVKRVLDDFGLEVVKAKKVVSQETREKISKSKKGKKPAWVGKPVTRNQLYSNMLAHIRFDVTKDWLISFDNFEKLKALNCAITPRSGRFSVSTEWYISYIENFYNDEKFNRVFEIWISSNKDPWKRPSLDHIHPTSKGGECDLDNFQFLSWFENRCKNNLSQEVWDDMKSRISEYLS